MIVKQKRLRKKIHKRLRRTTYREVTESAVSAEVVIFLLRGVQNFGEKQGMNLKTNPQVPLASSRNLKTKPQRARVGIRMVKI